MNAESAGDKKFQFKVTGNLLSQRLDTFLSSKAELSLSRNQIQKLIKDDRVLVNGQIPQKRFALSDGDIIELTLPLLKKSEITAENIELDIRFEDEFLAVVNKPAGMVVHPAVGNRSGTLVNALMYHFENLAQGGGAERAGIVHRLDKNSSGLLLVARTDVVHRELQKALQERGIKREYLALVCGRLKDAKGLIKTHIDRSKKDRKKMAVTKTSGREAVTEYELRVSYRSYQLLKLSLQTGRTHQIRVHLAHLGHPVFGDPEYGGREKWHRGIFAPERPLAKKLLDLLPRQALHAQRLEFVHPVKNVRVIIESEIPADFQRVIDLLEKEGC
ncbi:MAG: RluA family pseudouridine synthase [candidate division Zixibacteria bacterium]